MNDDDDDDEIVYFRSYKKASEDSSAELTSLADAYLIFDTNTTEALKRNMDDLYAETRDQGEQDQNAKKELKCSKRLFKLCAKGRSCLKQLKESLDLSTQDPKYDPEVVRKEIFTCKSDLGSIHLKIKKKKSEQKYQTELIKSTGNMIQSIIDEITEMPGKVKGFQTLELKDLLANISDMQSKMSGFIEQNFEQFEKERKEKESTHGNLIPLHKPKMPIAEQIHYQAEITIQSYKHLQHAKEQYVSQIDKIREVM